jgi:hypothetical protein
MSGRKKTSGSRWEEGETRLSDSKDHYDAQVDWTSVAPIGDTLAVSTGSGLDDRWARAFEVVLDDHETQATERPWGRIDLEDASDENSGRFVLLVRQIEPEAKAFELRWTINELVKSANTVARVGTHVYELARELREPEPETRHGSVPPPIDPLDDELDQDAA